MLLLFLWKTISRNKTSLDFIDSVSRSVASQFRLSSILDPVNLPLLGDLYNDDDDVDDDGIVGGQLY